MSTRTTRSKTKQLKIEKNNEFNKIMDELSSSKKKRITENWKKWTNKLRDNIKSKKEKTVKERKIKIKDYPPKLIRRILLSIGNEYKEHDETIASFIYKFIEFDNYKQDILMIIDIIYEIYSNFLLNLIRWMYQDNYLKTLDNPYLSDNDELSDWLPQEKDSFKKKYDVQIELIEQYGNLLNKIIIIFKSIIKSKNLLNIENEKILNFINKLDFNWRELIEEYKGLEKYIFIITREDRENERKKLRKDFNSKKLQIINFAYDNVLSINEDLLKEKLSEIKNIYNDTNLYPKKKLESLMRKNK
tara:strand:+ start:11 stop:916 length:906 start_codon:yes stop_codon:yes gene_type:complete